MFKQGKLYVLENGMIAVYNGRITSPQGVTQHAFRTVCAQREDDMSFAVELDGKCRTKIFTPMVLLSEMVKDFKEKKEKETQPTITRGE